jgi:hypothetical protein
LTLHSTHGGTGHRRTQEYACRHRRQAGSPRISSQPRQGCRQCRSARPDRRRPALVPGTVTSIFSPCRCQRSQNRAAHTPQRHRPSHPTVQPSQRCLTRRGQIPIAQARCTAARAYPIAVSSPGGFRTPAARVCPTAVSGRASETLHTSGHAGDALPRDDGNAGSTAHSPPVASREPRRLLSSTPFQSSSAECRFRQTEPALRG